MLEEFLSHPVVAAILGGVVGAAAADYKAFQSWNSFQEAAAYNWATARWRWFQGAVVGLVTGLGHMGIVRVVTTTLLVLSMGVAVGCGARRPDLNQIPVALESTTEDVNAAGAKAIGILTSGARIVRHISWLEQQAVAEGVVPAEADAMFDRAIVAYANASDEAVRRVLAGATSWEQLRSILEPVVAQVQRLYDMGSSIGAIRDRLVGWFAVLRDVVMEGIGQLLVGRNFSGVTT